MYIGFRVAVISMYLTFYLYFYCLFCKRKSHQHIKFHHTANEYNPTYLVFLLVFLSHLMSTVCSVIHYFEVLVSFWPLSASLI